MSKENQIEENLIEQLKGLKYIHRPDIVDRKTLEQNFRTTLSYKVCKLKVCNPT